MERRVLIAILLSFIVLYAYQAFVVKPPPKPLVQTASTTTQAGKSAPGGVKPATPAAAAPAAPTASTVVGDTTERDVRRAARQHTEHVALFSESVTV